MPFLSKGLYAQSDKAPVVIAGAQPLTGIFSFAGVDMHRGLDEYVKWQNANGGIAGRPLRYVFEDTGFKLDQGVAVVKKLMASDKPNFFYIDGTPLVKATARDLQESGHVMSTSTSCAEVLCDPVNMPQHFLASPTYASMLSILMEHISRQAKGGAKPTVALVYSDTEFGRDGIPGAKARAEKLGIPIVLEIVTKQSGIDVAPEVARLRRARPDYVIFQGYVLAPIPEFVKQMTEAGLKSQVLGTIWSMSAVTYNALAALNADWMGVMPYAYGHDKDSKSMADIRKQFAAAYPDVKDVSPFVVHGWLSGMIFGEIARRCITADKPLTLPNMQAALKSITAMDTGGISGLPVNLSSHQIASGRLYRLNQGTKQMDPASDWIAL
ncbi:ABC transporter substrate-binding protein [Ferrovibrio sp.]|uniref:ABC transporter substrate-binding protein n=1 Tax=Ferrovibrio sp. TaxID=1917215 RepID=UPI003D0EA8FF